MKFGILLSFFLFYFSISEARRGGLGGLLGLKNCQPYSYDNVQIDIPATFDAREQWPACVSPIRDQGECGGCWAVSSTSVLADRYCIASNNTIRRLLSPQYTIDCNTNCQFPLLNAQCQAGCNGGYLDTAWNYFKTNGIVKDSCVTYTAQDGTCTTTCDDGEPISGNQTLFKSSGCYQFKTVRDAQIEILTNGPIQAGYMVYTDFDNYKKGEVYIRASDTQEGGHAVRIIGWGTQNGVEYWLVANSWGTGWGDSGYFMIRRGTNEAQIEDSMVAGQADLSAVKQPEYGPWGSTSGSAYVSRMAALFFVSFVWLCFL